MGRATGKDLLRWSDDGCRNHHQRQTGRQLHQGDSIVSVTTLPGYLTSGKEPARSKSSQRISQQIDQCRRTESRLVVIWRNLPSCMAGSSATDTHEALCLSADHKGKFQASIDMEARCQRA